ncbi:MAG: AmmeMemoRadiSam system protein B [Planctomycetota bacterium]|jgi:AmmeMemoRadiSam system protein B
MEKPKIRKVFPANTEKGSPNPFYLIDPFSLTQERFEVTEKELQLMRLMDGERTVEAIAQAYRDSHGESVESREICGFVEQLGDHLFLHDDRFRSAYGKAERAFQGESVRAMAHHGECYPEDPDAFAKVLETYLAPPGGPGGPDFTKTGPAVRGVFAPHIDISIAGTAYAHAFKPAVEDPSVDLFVILGTAHYRDVNPFLLTEKRFATPFGTVEVDRAFTADLKKAFGADLFQDELIHKVEHSVEFQVVFLDALLRGKRPFHIVPLLVSSFAGLVPEGSRPADTPLIADFLSALHETLTSRGRRACVVAGVDLAHVGLKFGDGFKPDDRTMADLESADRRSLAYACRLDGEGFWDDVMADGNARKVCGVAPMYVACKVMEGAEGEIVAYGSDYHPEEGFAVTYAGVVFKGLGNSAI